MSDADVPIFKGDTKIVEFVMITTLEIAPLVEGIDAGMHFEMLEGDRVTGRGKIETIEERSIDYER